jgi:hypothetical protein
MQHGQVMADLMHISREPITGDDPALAGISANRSDAGESAVIRLRKDKNMAIVIRKVDILPRS